MWEQVLRLRQVFGRPITLLLLIAWFAYPASADESEIYRPEARAEAPVSSEIADPRLANAWSDLGNPHLSVDILSSFRRHLSTRIAVGLDVTEEQSRLLDISDPTSSGCDQADLDSTRRTLARELPRPKASGGREFGIISSMVTEASEAFELGWHDDSIRLVLSIHQVLRGTVWTYSQAGVQFVAGRFFDLLGETSSARTAIATGLREWGPGLSYGGNSRNFHETQLFVGRALEAAIAGNTRAVVTNMAKARTSDDKAGREGFSARYFHRALMAEVEADSLMRSGEVRAAFEALLSAITSVDRYTPSVMTAVLLERLGLTALSSGEFELAETLAQKAIDVLEAKCALPNSLRLASARQTLLGALAAQSKWVDAIDVFEQNESTFGQAMPSAWETRFRDDPAYSIARLSAGATGDSGEVLSTVLGDDFDGQVLRLLASSEGRSIGPNDEELVDVLFAARRLEASGNDGLTADSAARLIMLIERVGIREFESSR